MGPKLKKFFYKSSHIFLYLWLFAIGSFFVSMQKDHQFIGATSLYVGIISFVLMIVSSAIFNAYRFKKKISNKKDGMIQTKLARLFTGLILLAFPLALLHTNGILLAKVLGISKYASPKPISTSGDSLQSIATPVPTIVVKALIAEPDPIIDCNINDNCGGGTRQLQQSVCNNSTCCKIGDNWYFYEDKSKCRPDQDAYWNNIFGKYSLPHSTSTYLPITTSTPTPTVDYSALNQRNIELRSQCLGDVARYCQTQVGSINFRGLGDSSKQNVANWLNSECGNLRKACERKYPVY